MIKKAKSIQELYEEVKDFDLVITNDAPLNTALNKCLSKTYLGNFALTSKLLGSMYSPYLFEEKQLQIEELILKVKKKFNLNLKKSLFYVKNILKVWQNIGSLEESKKFFSDIEKEIIEYLKELPTYQLSMEKLDLDFLNKSKVAVIGEELFTELDKKVLNPTVKRISLFKEEEHKLDNIYLFESKKDIIDRTVEMINKDNQNSIAIVLNVESEYLPLLKAKLITKGIDLNEKIFLHQDFRVREYISIIESIFNLYNVNLKELIPIGSIFNINIDETLENDLFLEISNKDKEAEKLLNLLQELKEKSFGEVVEFLGDYDLSLPYEFKEVLYKLELYNKKINKNDFLDLKYFIENFEIEIENNKRGVLLINAKNSNFINRDVIFYIGMDQTWVRNIENESYVYVKKEFEKNLKSFQILIQQGKERFFFVPKYNLSNETIPPYYFDFLFDNSVETYSEKFFNIKEIKNNFVTKNFKEVSKIKKDKVKRLDYISSSALNKFVECPKKYSYSKLIYEPKKDYFLKGELIHNFAQFYVDYKEFVLEKGLDEFLDIMMDELKSLSNPLRNKILRKKLKLGCEAVMNFIDTLKIEKVHFFKCEKSKKNIFFSHYNLPIINNNTELEFNDSELQLRGYIDLVVNSSLIVDYKTGKKKKSKEIVDKSNVDKIVTRCDFQPLVYLSVFRKLNPGKYLDFWYYFPFINTYKRLLDKDLEDEVVSVHYISKSIDEYVASEDFKDYLSDLLSNTGRSILLNFNSLDFFKKYNFSEILNNPEEYGENFINYHLENGMKNTVKNTNDCGNLFKYILDFNKGIKIGRNSQKEVFFFKEDLDKFESFVKENIYKINQYFKDKFPYKPVEEENTCKVCEYKKICLKQGGEK